MKELMTFTSIPAIVVITYLVCEAYKWVITDKNGNPISNKAMAFIPVLSGITGLTLGILCYIFIPQAVASDNIMTAAAIGITSGLAATGVHQVGKQINKLKKSS